MELSSLLNGDATVRETNPGSARPRNAPSPDDNRPEVFEFDGVAGLIKRTVARSQFGAGRVTTVVGHWHAAEAPQDLAAAADAVLLRASQRPKEAAGQTIRVADLFSGCGAMSLGIEEACRALGLRFESAGGFDIDQHAMATFARNFGLRGKRAEVCDLGAVLAKYALRSKLTRAEKQLRRRIGRVDLAIAGPPCQGNSDLNNKTRRDDPRNELYFRVARFAKVFTPRWIIVENVTAVQHDKGEVVRRTREALEALGYEVTQGVVNMCRIGVPQTRKRHILIAVRRKGHGKVEKPLDAISTMVSRYAVPERSAEWAIDDLRDLMGPRLAIDTPSKPTKTTRERIDWLFDNKEYDLPDRLRPKCHRDKPHTYKAVYGRIRPKKPAPTITGGFETMGRGRFVNPWERRTLTPHEAARIQSIPDWFDFSSTIAVRSRLAEIIGNAVPPKLSYVIALELLR